MFIKGKEYTLDWTIGASVYINDLYPSGAPKGALAGRYIMDLAIAMSRASEDIKKLEDSSYEKHPLTKELLYSLPPAYAKEIENAVNEAYKIGNEKTVEVEKN